MESKFGKKTCHPTQMLQPHVSAKTLLCAGALGTLRDYPSPRKLEIEKALLTAGPAEDKPKIKTKTNFLPRDPRM